MQAVFLKIVNMGFTAGWLILAVLLVRLLLKKAPRWIVCALWALVAIRLICPFSPESALSLIPKTEWIAETPQVQELTPPSAIDSEAISTLLPGTEVSIHTQSPAVTIEKHLNFVYFLPYLWLAGVAALLVYALVSYLRLRKSVGASLPVRGNVFACDEVQSPFILGVFRPKIYVPSAMDCEALELVIAHETAHIRRRDHWWKPLGYLLLSVYWFNPLCWLAYVLLCRDIELACDEKVIRGMDSRQMAAYSQALLDCSFPRRKIAACPLAFGEVGVKERVKSVLSYKKPAFWIIAAAVAACIVVAVCFGTDPMGTALTKWSITEVDMNKVVGNLSSLSVQYGDAVEDCNTSEINRFLATMSKIKIGRKPISISRDEGRSADFIITLNGGLKLNFNAEFSELWVGNGVKPSYTYKVMNPTTAEELLLDFNFVGGPNYEDIQLGSEVFTDYEGVYITFSSWEPDKDGHVSFQIEWHNDTRERITYGDSYAIERKEGDAWITAAPGEVAFDMIGYTLRPHSRVAKSYAATPFDISQKGTYRLIMPFSTDDGKGYQYSTWAEFQVNWETGIDEPSYVPVSAPVQPWFDCLHGDEMIWDGIREINLDEYPGVTFRWHAEKLEAVTDKETVTLFPGMPIWSVYFCDLNGDGKREICSSVSIGSGIVDTRIVVADYANARLYELSDRPGGYDYSLNYSSGHLLAEKRRRDEASDYFDSGFLMLQPVMGADGFSVPTLMLVHPDQAPSVGEDPGTPGRGPLYRSIPFEDRWYIRTNGYVEGAEYPKALWITSTEELHAYYEANKDRYALGSQSPGTAPTLGFADAMETYDDAFFESHDLILAVLEEPSGSVRHKVTAVNVYLSALDRIQFFVQPEIRRLAPDAGTCDMAEWHIFIEISKEYGMQVAQLELPEIY